MYWLCIVIVCRLFSVIAARHCRTSAQLARFATATLLPYFLCNGVYICVIYDVHCNALEVAQAPILLYVRQMAPVACCIIEIGSRVQCLLSFRSSSSVLECPELRPRPCVSPCGDSVITLAFVCMCVRSRSQLLEVDPASSTCVDISNIVSDRRGNGDVTGPLLTSSSCWRSMVKERPNSADFVDDADVPDLI